MLIRVCEYLAHPPTTVFLDDLAELGRTSRPVDADVSIFIEIGVESCTPTRGVPAAGTIEFAQGLPALVGSQFDAAEQRIAHQHSKGPNICGDALIFRGVQARLGLTLGAAGTSPGAGHPSHSSSRPQSVGRTTS